MEKRRCTEVSELDAEFLQCLLLEIFSDNRAQMTPERQQDILYAIGLLEVILTAGLDKASPAVI